MLRRALNLGLAGQAMTIKVSANLVVQAVKRASDPEHATFDLRQVVEFALYGLIGSQVGNVIQFILEDWFPTRNNAPIGGDMLPSAHVQAPGQDEKPKEKTDDSPTPSSSSSSSSAISAARRCLDLGPDVSWRNVLAKLILDQTIGFCISGCIFLICTNITRVSSLDELFLIIRQRLWPLIKAGWHLWPLVAICNFLWVPVRSRVLVAVCVGFGWSIFLSIFANRK
ncbi:Mpv17-like protein [Paramyrothecium foliicola]|nr:Mpv17-like protein [Paramyrothecium foliicola]